MLTNNNGIGRRCVIVVQNPRVVCPKIRFFFGEFLTQTSHNAQIILPVDGLAFWKEFMMHNTSVIHENRKHHLLFRPLLKRSCQRKTFDLVRDLMQTRCCKVDNIFFLWKIETTHKDRCTQYSVTSTNVNLSSWKSDRTSMTLLPTQRKKNCNRPNASATRWRVLKLFDEGGICQRIIQSSKDFLNAFSGIDSSFLPRILFCLLSTENGCLEMVIWVLEREKSRPEPYQVNTVCVRWYSLSFWPETVVPISRQKSFSQSL